MKKYKIIGGRAYAILYRKNGELEKCIFCGKQHSHGGWGHRIAHCSDENGVALRDVKIVVDSVNGKDVVVSNDDGYFVEELEY